MYVVVANIEFYLTKCVKTYIHGNQYNLDIDGFLTNTVFYLRQWNDETKGEQLLQIPRSKNNYLIYKLQTHATRKTGIHPCRPRELSEELRNLSQL